MSRRPVIGVLGGMGPAAAAEFYARLVAATPAEHDQDHLHVIIDSDPSVPDRTAALRGEGPSPVAALRQMARRLEDAGADLLVMACNTASAFVQEAANAVSVPFVRWNDVVAAELTHDVSPGRSVAVLATDGTHASGLYHYTLSNNGFVAFSAAAMQHEVTGIVRARKAGVPVTELAPRLDAVIRSVRADGASVALLACTELSELAGRLTVSAVDAMDLVVRHLLRRVSEWEAHPGAFIADGLLAVQQAQL
jgi:aspartate racemase